MTKRAVGSISVAVFCPQSKAPQEGYLSDLRDYLCSRPRLQPLVEEIKGLSSTWKILADARSDIAALGQGPRHVKSLHDWIVDGHVEGVANAMSGILALPLLTIIQVTQYFQYLESMNISHKAFLNELQVGGAQGYCGGLLPVAAIATSCTEEDVVRNAATSMRIAMCIGAFGELGDDENVPGPTTIAVRLKHAGQGEELVEDFAGAYVSAVTDPRTISIVGPVHTLKKVKEHAESLGLLVSAMHLRGKVHNPENKELAKELCEICDAYPTLQLPHTGHLQIPVRSNKDGRVLAPGYSLTHEIVETVLTSRCEWFDLLTNVAADISSTGQQSHHFAIFGIGDCVPLLPFNKNRLKINKIDVLSLVKGPNLGPSASEFPSDAIAVVGAACRLPGADSLDELWSLMSQGASKAQQVPLRRVDLPGSWRVKHDLKWAHKQKFYGNFIDDVDTFDHQFFGVSPREATYMDPQQRLLLETAFQALDSSGYLRHHDREDFDKVGCFIGASFTEYLENTSAYSPTAYTATGTIRAFLCGKISYHFGWSGPSEVIDTACSASLVAIHRACRAIQNNECHMALAGGVNIISGIHNYLDMGKAGFLSPTGNCKPFDKDADGYCRADGVGLVVLKPLTQAMTDGDHILGVIPGVSTNQGSLSPSITVPHGRAQVLLYKDILRRAGLQGHQVSYVEAHGTGTQAGDPVEVASIREVFGGADRKHPLHIGSLKANVGHSETAAGVNGLIKVLAMLQNGKIPPLAGFQTLNPKIPALETDNMTVDRYTQHWKSPFRVACVNSYGAAGSNAALICCEPPATRNRSKPPPSSSFPVFISAATEHGLREYFSKLEAYLRSPDPENGRNLGDVALTLRERRKHHRVCWIDMTSSTAELTQKLKGEPKTLFEPPAKSKPVVLLVAGQSKQNIELDRAFYDQYPRFRHYIDLCDTIVREQQFPGITPAIFDTQPIHDVVILQCGTFAVQYACAKCWIDAGLEVAAVVGHSFGELSALAITGAISLEDAIHLIGTRATLMQTRWGPERGSMLAVHENRKLVEDILNITRQNGASNALEIACFNSPLSQVVVGAHDDIELTRQVLRENPKFAHIKHQSVNVTHGFHSIFTEPILEGLQEIASTIQIKTPKIPLECCTEIPFSGPMDAKRIMDHARTPVYFADAISRLEKRLGPCIFLEAGLESPIVAMGRRATTNAGDHLFLPVKGPASTVAAVTAELWKQGIATTFWNFITPVDVGLKPVWLPPYQFVRSRHWLDHVDRTNETKELHAESQASTALAPPKKLVTRSIQDRGSKLQQFVIHADSQRFQAVVSGHAVRNKPLAPASLYMECVVMAAQILESEAAWDSIHFQDVAFHGAMGVSCSRSVLLSMTQRSQNMGWDFAFESQSLEAPQSKKAAHARGTFTHISSPRLQSYERLVQDRIRTVISDPRAEKLLSGRAYALFSRVVTYAPFLRGISQINILDNEAVAEIQLPGGDAVGGEETTARQICDTVTLDTFFQVVGFLINSGAKCPESDVFIASAIESIVINKRDFHSNDQWTVYVTLRWNGDSQVLGDMFVFSGQGALSIVGTGIRFSKVSIVALEKVLDSVGYDSTSPNDITSNHSSVGINKVTANSNTHPSPPGSTTVTRELASLISLYTGVPEEDIQDDVRIGNLGLDSLAAVELADEIQARTGQEISNDQLPNLTLAELCGLISLSASPMLARESVLPESITVEVVQAPNHTNGCSQTTSTGTSFTTQRVLELISESTGAPIENINYKATLRDIGLDSLSAIELKDSLEEAFAKQIGDHLSIESTVEDVFSYVQPLTPTSQDLSDPPSAFEYEDPVSTTTLPNGVKKANSSQGRYSLIDPLKALIESDQEFDETLSGGPYLNYWRDVVPGENRLLVAYICEAFRKLGADLVQLKRGDKIPIIPHAPKYTRLMERLWQVLSNHGLVEIDRSIVTRTQKDIPGENPSSLHDQFIRVHPSYAVGAELMRLTGSRLAGYLSGTINSVQSLFEEGAIETTLTAFYRSSPLHTSLNARLLKFLLRVIQGAHQATIRVLEVEASLDGPTAMIAEALGALDQPVDFTFTSSSSSILKAAQTRFRKYNWMNFLVLDLQENVPESMAHQYDIVFRGNHLHISSDKRTLCSRLEQLLAPGGFAVLSEIAHPIDWYDITFGILDDSWTTKLGSHGINSAQSWMEHLQMAGFESWGRSKGSTAEARTHTLIVGSVAKLEGYGCLSETLPSVDTVIYKAIGGVRIHADVYLPRRRKDQKMPIALMIHGGGHMTLSRKAVRPAQISYLLANDIIPVSVDYRLCPEINLIDGPIADVADAYLWLQSSLPAVVSMYGISVDTARIALVGWSSGGQLAMTTTWNVKERTNTPPRAVLAFYSPTDFISRELDTRRAEEYPGRTLSIEEIRQALSAQPITSYDCQGSTDRTGLGWVRPGDPRSELVLSLFKEGTGLSLMLNGLPDDRHSWEPVEEEKIVKICPSSQLRRGNYTTPTFIVACENDEIVPFESAVRFTEMLRKAHVPHGFLSIPGAKHLHDLHITPDSRKWKSQVEPGYRFLIEKLKS